MTPATLPPLAPILHHYDTSPFAEKVRLMLGFKGLAWQSVKTPQVMPKPDQVALTGGHRRAPVLQIGADVYCDSALIARVLERLQPAPTLFPASAPLAPMLAQWADSTLFWTVIPYTMQPAGLAALFAGRPPEVLQAFAADRKPFSAGIKRLSLADAALQLKAALAAFDAQLADGRRWLFGAEASIADFSVAHCLWFVRRAPPVAGVLDAALNVQRWLNALLSAGHGQSQPLDSAQALAIAAASTPAPLSGSETVMSGQGFEAGERVSVAATDYGTEPSFGTLVGLAADEIVIARSDPRAGTVHVHFPRRGFQIKADIEGGQP
jgi:glutathione S-transferase